MRRIAAVTLGGLAFLGFAGTPASADPPPDPQTETTCLTQAAGDITSLVDPASPAAPPEVTGAACLAP